MKPLLMILAWLFIGGLVAGMCGCASDRLKNEYGLKVGDTVVVQNTHLTYAIAGKTGRIIRIPNSSLKDGNTHVLTVTVLLDTGGEHLVPAMALKKIGSGIYDPEKAKAPVINLPPNEKEDIKQRFFMGDMVKIRATGQNGQIVEVTDSVKDSNQPGRAQRRYKVRVFTKDKGIEASVFAEMADFELDP